MKRKFCVVIVIAVFLSVFAYSLVLQQAEVYANTDSLLEVTFSHESGFFVDSFALTLTAPQGARIFYTLDGSYPTMRSNRFNRPIRVEAPRPGRLSAAFGDELLPNISVYSVRAIAVMGRETSEVFTRNFVIGTYVHDRFCENTLIFALNSDPHGLYDHYDGIFVMGVDCEILRQKYYDRHGRLPEFGYAHNQENPGSPANFNRRGRESERPVHVEMFDNTGTLHISQRAGMRVRGGFSRAAEPQKSLELFAREEYGDRNNFRFAFFDDEFTHDGQLIDRYRRVRLRNGGSDRNAGFIRDELSQTLFRQAGHTTTQSHAPAAVFLNGEYHGVAWLKTPRTENHLARIFGGDSSNFEIVDGGDNRLIASRWHGEPRAVEDMREVSALAMQGFVGTGGDARLEEFAQRVDLDALIRYYAMQIYINNIDWPNHNIEMWRYFPTDEEKNDPNLHPYLRDGRWRVFAHDLEAAWSIWDDDNQMARDDTLYDILTGTNDRRWNSRQSSAFLYAIVGHSDTRAKLANTFIDLIDGAFAPDNVERTLDELISMFENEHNYAVRTLTINPANRFWPSVQSYRNSHDAIRRFAQIRPQTIHDSIRTNLGFNMNRKFAVDFTTSAGGRAIMNSRPIGEVQTVTGNYFAGTTINITAIPNAGYVVDYWMVDDVRESGNVITVGSDATVRLYFAVDVSPPTS